MMEGVVQALSAVMDQVQAVKKADKNTHQGFMFRGIDAVVNAVGPALRKHGVVVVPSVESVDYEQVQTSTGKPSTACRVVVTYTFHHGTDSLPVSVAAEAWDAGDKAAPKAMSVAFRTALLQALCLPTDEPDPDSHSYERAEPVVNLEPLEQLIVTAQDEGLVGEWEKARAYAEKSQGHADRAVQMLREKLEAHRTGAE
jgi:hypothetical protein